MMDGKNYQFKGTVNTLACTSAGTLSVSFNVKDIKIEHGDKKHYLAYCVDEKNGAFCEKGNYVEVPSVFDIDSENKIKDILTSFKNSMLLVEFNELKGNDKKYEIVKVTVLNN